MEKEEIVLDNAEPTSVAELNSRFPTDHARYHLFLYKHSHEGDYLESIGMIYRFITVTVVVLRYTHISYCSIVRITITFFVVFIYSMPGYRCPIKERMLYSSCKNELLEVLDAQMGITLVRKVTFSCNSSSKSLH